MKKITLIPILVFFHLLITAQSYTPFTTDTRWSYTISPFIDSGNPNDFPITTRGFYYEIKGDTIINEILHSKVYYKPTWYKTYHQLGYLLETGTSLTAPILVGATREDIQDKKVYFLNLTNTDSWSTCFFDTNLEINNEYLLYDFDIEVGDTVQFNYPTEYPLILEEKSIEKLSNGEERNVYTFYQEETLSHITWIEGIGATHEYGGLFSAMMLFPFEGGCELNCIKETDFYHLYSPINDDGDCDNLDYFLNNIITPTALPSDISLSPNPSNGTFYIQTELNSNLEIQVIDLSGTRIPISIHSTSLGYSFNIKHKPEGIYILKIITDDHKIYFHKICKIQ